MVFRGFSARAPLSRQLDIHEVRQVGIRRQRRHLPGHQAILEILLVNTWWIHGEYMVNTWWIHGEYMVNTWWIHGEYMVNTWWIHGEYMVNTWWIHGEYMVNTWWIHGEYMVNTWSVKMDTWFFWKWNMVTRRCGCGWWRLLRWSRSVFFFIFVEFQLQYISTWISKIYQKLDHFPAGDIIGFPYYVRGCFIGWFPNDRRLLIVSKPVFKSDMFSVRSDVAGTNDLHHFGGLKLPPGRW